MFYKKLLPLSMSCGAVIGFQAAKYNTAHGYYSHQKESSTDRMFNIYFGAMTSIVCGLSSTGINEVAHHLPPIKRIPLVLLPVPIVAAGWYYIVHE